MENKHDEEFDKLFSRDLKRSGRRERPDSEEWDKLSMRLDANDKKKPWAAILLWCLVPILLGTSVWSVSELHTIKSELRELKATNAQNALSMEVTPQPITIHDTIYKTIIIAQKSHPNLTTASPETIRQNPMNATAALSSDTPSNETLLSLLRENQNLIAALSGESTLLQDSIFIIQKRNQDQFAENAPTDERSPGPKAENKAPIHQDQTLGVPIKRVKEKAPQRIGFGLGMVDLGRLQGMDYSAPVSASLKYELGLNGHWSIAAELNYASYRYSIGKNFDQRLMVEIPPAPGPEYTFNYYKGRTQHLMPALALRYRMRPQKKYSYYAGLGYSARQTLPETADCEYLEAGVNDKYTYKVKVDVRDRWLMSLVQIGAELNLFPRFALFAEANEMFDLGQGQRTFPMFTGQFGLKYDIK